MRKVDSLDAPTLFARELLEVERAGFLHGPATRRDISGQRALFARQSIIGINEIRVCGIFQRNLTHLKTALIVKAIGLPADAAAIVVVRNIIGKAERIVTVGRAIGTCFCTRETLYIRKGIGRAGKNIVGVCRRAFAAYALRLYRHAQLLLRAGGKRVGYQEAAARKSALVVVNKIADICGIDIEARVLGIDILPILTHIAGICPRERERAVGILSQSDSLRSLRHILAHESIGRLRLPSPLGVIGSHLVGVPTVGHGCIGELQRLADGGCFKGLHRNGVAIEVFGAANNLDSVDDCERLARCGNGRGDKRDVGLGLAEGIGRDHEICYGTGRSFNGGGGNAHAIYIKIIGLCLTERVESQTIIARLRHAERVARQLAVVIANLVRRNYNRVSGRVVARTDTDFHLFGPNIAESFIYIRKVVRVFGIECQLGRDEPIVARSRHAGSVLRHIRFLVERPRIAVIIAVDNRPSIERFLRIESFAIRRRKDPRSDGYVRHCCLGNESGSLRRYGIFPTARLIIAENFGKARRGKVGGDTRAVGQAYDIVTQQHGIDITGMNALGGCFPREVGLVVVVIVNRERQISRGFRRIVAYPSP